ncbi:hypothetical protein ILYODFUR_018707 [Ilyodon furcidens]|uniref:Uncharacterized protein n=1 Tax=Ilyodon furcidens TaxID=33524 RepID=A0ABV0VF45_9TELE
MQDYSRRNHYPGLTGKLIQRTSSQPHRPASLHLLRLISFTGLIRRGVFSACCHPSGEDRSGFVKSSIKK